MIKESTIALYVAFYYSHQKPNIIQDVDGQHFIRQLMKQK